MTELKKAYTTGEVAHLIGVTSRTVGLMVDNGDIKGFKLPRGDRRIPRDSLITYLKSIHNEAALRDIGE